MRITIPGRGSLYSELWCNEDRTGNGLDWPEKMLFVSKKVMMESY